jgi:hypothetical protein
MFRKNDPTQTNESGSIRRVKVNMWEEDVTTVSDFIRRNIEGLERNTAQNCFEVLASLARKGQLKIGGVAHGSNNLLK